MRRALCFYMNSFPGKAVIIEAGETHRKEGYVISMSEKSGDEMCG